MVGKYIKGEDPKHNIKIYQASSSEMYGDSPPPQNEMTQFNPRSPYGVAKVFAHNMAKVYRDSYNMFVTSGILFNHESERRGIEFVSMKIANAVARIDAGLQNKLKLGNLDAKRDWGYTKDYVKAMWLMMQQEKPDNFVIASGKSHSIREFVDIAFSHIGLDWQEYVEVDKSFFRPAEIYDLVGDYRKAERVLGWKPKTSFEDLVKIMVDNEIKKLTQQ
jgi:GDPmannose 4,6-dehydratase